jgi:hypothetical protein
VAATVALIAIVGTIPYIALQLKAVSVRSAPSSATSPPTPAPAQPVLGDLRCSSRCRWRPSPCCSAPPHRRHRAPGRADAGDRGGIAGQAVRFLAVGVFVTFWMFDGRDLFARRWSTRHGRRADARVAFAR